ncbi:MAG: hypothetical protein Q7S57_05900 [bacterium]|nr:hypothetical protein [bacterium]
MNRKIVTFVILLCFVAVAGAYRARAGIGSCAVSVSPSNLATNIAGSLNFSVTNNDGALEAKWIKVSAPSQNYEIQSGSGSGWPGSVGSPTEVTFHGTLSAGSNVGLGINVQTSTSSTAPAVWSVQISDQTDGSGAVSCTGDTNVSIGEQGMDSVSPVISDVSVFDITSSGAIIRWTTNEVATSVVDYGKTTGYGDKKEVLDLVESHEVTIQGLTADTTYHYRIKSADSAGNTAQTSDNTFATAKITVTPTPTPATPTSSSEPTTQTTTVEVVTITSTPIPTVKPTPKPKPIVVPTPTPTPTVPQDILSPRVAISTDLSKPFEVAPVISGRAVDESGIGVIDYSLDGGGNWLPVNSRKGTTMVDFSFSPIAVSDDSYKIIVRARDLRGNSGTAQTKLVIDRLAPMIGPAYVSFGPQSLLPVNNDWFETSEGVDLKVVVSAVGGPEIVDLIAENKNDQQIFSLVKNTETGLWSGTLSFAKIGDYVVKVRAKDGAGRVLERDLLNFRVLEQAKLLASNGEPLIKANVSIFIRDASSNRFILWDAEPFGLENPIVVSEKGKFPLVLPDGEYYLLVKAGNFYRGQTPIFKIRGIGALPAILKASSNNFFSSVFSKVWPTAISLQFNLPERKASDQSALVGKEVPFVGLSSENGVVFSSDLKGKPMILTFVADWVPDTVEQMANLSNISQDKIATAGVFIQTTLTEAVLYKSRGNYQLKTYVDPNGESVVPFDIHALPTTYFIDRNGIVMGVKAGVMTREEIRKEITQLGL